MLLTKKMALSEFKWTEEAQGAMDLLKHLALTVVPVRMLDYELARKVKQPDQRESDVGLVSIHVDTSNIGVGWMIAQRLEDAEYPVVFGSITLNECEGCYSQPKLELYGVFRVLKVEQHCHDQFPWIWKGGPREPDLAQLLGQALSHRVSDSDREWFTGVS